MPSCCVAAAAKLASMDDSIESKTCAVSGKVSYYQKSTCPASGKVTSSEVTYDKTAKKFVNVSPSKKAAAAGGKNVKKAATAKKVSATAKKSCAAKCTKSAASCGSKSANASKAKLVKTTVEEN